MRHLIKYLIAVYSSLYAIHISAQTNLIPNPSFETYSSCPWALAEIDKATPWFQPCSLFSSTDFFHNCSTFQADVPINFCGYQIPKSGFGYAGIIIYSTVPSPPSNFPRPYREYLEVKMIDSLKAGKEYCVEFYLSLANNYNIITNEVGVYFSKDSVLSNDFKNLTYTPQIENSPSNLLNDTLGWMKITGSFIAMGGEKFMTIGNFKDDTNTYADTLSTNSKLAYLYIDDISVKEMVNVTADAGTNKNICIADSVLLGSSLINPRFQYLWSPSTGLSNIYIAQPYSKPIVTTKYYLTVTDTATACGLSVIDSTTVIVHSYQSPIVNAGTTQTICPGDTVNIGISPTIGYIYSWSPFINLSDANNSQPFVFPNQTTLYKLTVIDTASNYLCKSVGTDSVLITVNECPPEIPNVFTPNGDGVNDGFVIDNLPVRSSVSIFNRWGVEVININVSGSFLWDGRTSSGTQCQDGVYYYIVVSSTGKTYNGFISLLR